LWPLDAAVLSDRHKADPYGDCSLFAAVIE
jgi:hypothetical protein